MEKDIKKNEEETVTLKKTELDAIMASIKRLEFAADKSHLAHFDEKNRGDRGRIVKLRMIDGKVVLSWDDMVENLVEKDSAGRWKESQTVKINYEDGKSEKIDLVIFNRRFVSLPAEIISETKMSDGIILKVKTEDGKTYEINSKFIN